MNQETKKTDADQIVVVVPCYNEADRLPVTEFDRFARDNSRCRFLFVDDGSTDGTGSVLDRLCESLPASFSQMRLDRNSGKAEAVRRGMLEAFDRYHPDYAGFWDADLATPLAVIPQCTGILEARPEILILLGARVKLMGHDIRRKALRHYLGRIFATCASTALNLSVYDTQCGAKVFRSSPEMREIFSEPFLSRWIFDVELLARYIRQSKKTGTHDYEKTIYEMPLPQWTDVGGSKVKPSDFIKAFGELFRIYIRYR